MRPTRHFWLLLIAFLLPLPFLLLKQLAPGDTLWLQRLWDTGHVILFAVWMIIAVRLLPLPRTAIYLIARALGLFGFAVSIEFIQRYTGREFSLLDMYLDAGGIALGARLSITALRNLPPVPRSCLDLLLAVLLAVGLREAAMYTFDRAYMEVQFPQLWSADQPFPIARFAYPEKYTIVDDGNDNTPSLQATFITADYSTIELLELAGNWRGYVTLNIEVVNPQPAAFDLTCRIHDEAHFANGGDFDDRFNHRFTLQPGLNHLSVALADIESAPLKRKMQMDHIQGLACFTIKLQEPKNALFRAIWLGR